jgi:hypothetical protein
MEFTKNMLAAIGVMALLVLVINTASAGAVAIVNAYDRSQAGQTALIAEHKAYLASDDDYVTDPMNGFDDEVYEASEKAKVAKHANLFISTAYGRE